MLPQNPPTDSGHPGGTVADTEPNPDGGTSGAGGPETLAGIAASEADSETEDSGVGEEAEDAPSDGGGQAAAAAGAAPSEVPRKGKSPYSCKDSHRISDVVFRAAVKEAEGNAVLVAQALGLNKRNVHARIARCPELRALYCGKNGGYLRDPAGPDKPSGLAPFQRQPSDIPVDLKGPSLLDAVELTDREQYRRALLAYGVSDKYIAKSRALDGMAKNAGRLMAVSMNMTHQNYMGQLHVLGDVADDVRERMKGHKNEDGTYSPLNPQDFATLARVVTEITKEMRAGTTLVMQSTEALIRMENAINGKGNPEAGGKAKPAWGKSKTVNPPKPNAQDSA